MASFTDIIPKFNPYIQQLPVEAMVSVGMEKQKRYDEGIQKIQTQIDKVAGLDVIRDIDKSYLQSKLNELGNNLKGVAAGDFSNFQLVNSVSGMTNQIAKDPTVQNAISSTAWYRKQRERIQKDVDEGKSSPDNIYKFDKQASAWLNSTNPGESFSATYKPHFDVFKFAKETFDAIQPDGYSFDQIYQLDKNGKPIVVKDKNGNETLVYSTTMTRLEREGKFPKKVKETVAQIFSDPRVAEQLSITGEYNYRNYDTNSLVQKINKQKEERRNYLEDLRLDLSARLKNGENVQDDLDSVDESLRSIDSVYESYIKSAKENPDFARGNLYKEEVNDRFVTMFGKIKTSQQVMDNPAWKAQFEMQKEANAQSRWAQTEQRERSQFAQEMSYKDRALRQAWDIAVLNATTKGTKGKGKTSGLGVAEDTSAFEQGNQFSDVDVIRLQQADYDQAANDFSKSSADFIWDNAGFGDIAGNKRKYENLVNSGKSPSEAKLSILQQFADSRKIPVSEFMATYVNKAVKNYQKLTPDQLAKNPSYVDSYRAFSNSEQAFKTQQGIQYGINRQVPGAVQASNAVKQVLNSVSDRKIKLNGTEYNITKDDVYDLGIWLKGNLSVLGTAGGVDEHIRTAANEAERRLKTRGKESLVNFVKESNMGKRAYRGGPITFLSDVVTSGFGVIPMVKAATVGASDYGLSELDKDIQKVFKAVDTKDFVQSYKGKADAIRKAYGIRPNLKAPVFTGDSETDRQLLYDVKRWAGEYSTASGDRMNASSDFADFAESIGAAKDPSDITLSAQPTVKPDGSVAVEIIAYNKESKRAGGMTIQPDEALGIGIDVNTIYESRDVAALRNYINYNKGLTSSGNPKSKDTYIQGDSYFKEDNFTGLQGSGYRAQGNIVHSNGKYYPIVYVTDGVNSEVRELPGSPNLGAATSALLGIKPIFAKAVLNKY